MLAYEGNGNSEGYGNMANPWFGGFCFVLFFLSQRSLNIWLKSAEIALNFFFLTQLLGCCGETNDRAGYLYPYVSRSIYLHLYIYISVEGQRGQRGRDLL